MSKAPVYFTASCRIPIRCLIKIKAWKHMSNRLFCWYANFFVLFARLKYIWQYSFKCVLSLHCKILSLPITISIFVKDKGLGMYNRVLCWYANFFVVSVARHSSRTNTYLWTGSQMAGFSIHAFLAWPITNHLRSHCLKVKKS